MVSAVHPGLGLSSCPLMCHRSLWLVELGAPNTTALQPTLYVSAFVNMLGKALLFRFKEEEQESLRGRAAPEDKEPEAPGGSRRDKPGVWSPGASN